MVYSKVTRSVFFLLGLGASKKCTIQEDLRYEFAECDPRTQTTTAHFYYEDNCESDSEPVPPYMPNV
jgi:hypothetical protein